MGMSESEDNDGERSPSNLKSDSDDPLDVSVNKGCKLGLVLSGGNRIARDKG